LQSSKTTKAIKKKQTNIAIEFFSIKLDSKTIELYLFFAKLLQACNVHIATIIINIFLQKKLENFKIFKIFYAKVVILNDTFLTNVC